MKIEKLERRMSIAIEIRRDLNFCGVLRSEDGKFFGFGIKKCKRENLYFTKKRKDLNWIGDFDLAWGLWKRRRRGEFMFGEFFWREENLFELILLRRMGKSNAD